MPAKRLFLAALFLCASQAASWAALREEWKDENKDGKKETHFFYDGNTIVKTEADNNGDGKPDVFIEYKNGERYRGEVDKNHDGIIEQWYWYGSDGHMLQKTLDTNGDRKPDQYNSFYHGGRDFVTKEVDANFDGKIDKRQFTQWDANKSIPVPAANGMTRIPNPGYVTIWKEEDKNFDGVIDFYLNKKDKKKNKVGQPMDPRHMEIGDEELKTEAEQQSSGPKKPEVETRVERMNERYGLE